MALQPYSGDGGNTGTSTALVIGGREISQEEYEKRQRDAAELEEKLRFIVEKIPTRIVQVMGSNAGAGSGEFHMYRMARRREMMRVQRMEEEAARKEQQTAFEEQRDRLQKEQEERTAKRRAKRLKRKAKKKAKTGDTGAGAGNAGYPGSSSDEEQQAALPPQAALD